MFYAFDLCRLGDDASLDERADEGRCAGPLDRLAQAKNDHGRHVLRARGPKFSIGTRHIQSGRFAAA